MLTRPQREAIERSYRAAVKRAGPLRGPACPGPGHRDCGHGVFDLLLKALGSEYDWYGCELEPMLAELRAGLELPLGGIKQLWIDRALVFFD